MHSISLRTDSSNSENKNLSREDRWYIGSIKKACLHRNNILDSNPSGGDGRPDTLAYSRHARRERLINPRKHYVNAVIGYET